MAGISQSSAVARSGQAPTVSSSAVRASVILCTHNRGDALATALDSVLRCEVEDDAYEVIVVDNASTDRTPQLLEQRIRELPGRPLRVVREERVGQQHARHLGARSARSSLLLFTDDDIEAAPGWVQAYIDAFKAHPEMQAAGGPIRPLWESDPPAWLLEYMSRDEYSVTGGECCGPLALLDRGEDFLLDPDGYFFGNNMAIRYETLKRLGGFYPDRSGGESIGPGEWAIVEAMQSSGTPIGYVPGAVIAHHVSTQRMSPEFFEKWPGPRDEMFDRWHGRPRTPRAVAAELWRILRASWQPWLRAAFTRRRGDAEAVRVRVHGARGGMELRWLWRMITRRDLRALLDTERFGP